MAMVYIACHFSRTRGNVAHQISIETNGDDLHPCEVLKGPLCCCSGPGLQVGPSKPGTWKEFNNHLDPEKQVVSRKSSDDSVAKKLDRQRESRYAGTDLQPLRQGPAGPSEKSFSIMKRWSFGDGKFPGRAGEVRCRLVKRPRIVVSSANHVIVACFWTRGSDQR